MSDIPTEIIECNKIPVAYPPQHQDLQPGIEYIMKPLPIFDNPAYKGSGKLKGKVAIITGGDSGIGRAVAVAYAKEGADIAIAYLSPREKPDAMNTVNAVSGLGRKIIAFEGDVSDESFCYKIVNRTAEIFGKIDILVNNAAVIKVQDSIEKISAKQLLQTFTVNVFAYFYMVKAALPFLKLQKYSAIINTASVTANEPYTLSLDYAASKGAVVSFTKSLAKALINDGIRVNSISPGMTWTPFIPSSQSDEQVMIFGRDRPMCRAAEPVEIAPSYVFLASEIDSSYITGQNIIVN